MRNVLHELFDGKLSRDQMEYEKGKAYSRAYDAAVVAEEELLVTLTEMKRKVRRYSHRENKKARLRTFLVWTNRRASVYAESNGLMGS